MKDKNSRDMAKKNLEIYDSYEELSDIEFKQGKKPRRIYKLRWNKKDKFLDDKQDE